MTGLPAAAASHCGNLPSSQSQVPDPSSMGVHRAEQRRVDRRAHRKEMMSSSGDEAGASDSTAIDAGFSGDTTIADDGAGRPRPRPASPAPAHVVLPELDHMSQNPPPLETGGMVAYLAMMLLTKDADRRPDLGRARAILQTAAGDYSGP